MEQVDAASVDLLLGSFDVNFSGPNSGRICLEHCHKMRIIEILFSATSIFNNHYPYVAL